jgi:hypothetical protein
MKLDEKAYEAAFDAYFSTLDLSEAITAYLTAAPPAPVAEVEPVAWVFELAGWIVDGKYARWGKPQLSFDEPCVPEGSVRNLRPLYASLPRTTSKLEHPEVVELAKRLRSVNGEQAPYANDQVREWCHKAAAALTALSARLAECERERDEARNAAVESSGIAGEACIRATNARARVEALEKALKPFADIAQYIEEHCHDIDDNDETSVSIGDLFAARAALNKGEG